MRIIRSNERGRSHYGGLDSRHAFLLPVTTDAIDTLHMNVTSNTEMLWFELP
jgi:hypothetical protein